MVFILRTQKLLPADSDATLVLPDFSRSEVDALLRVLYGRDGDDGVPEELLNVLGCSYEVAQLTTCRLEGETPGTCEWDMKDNSGTFLCPEADCGYAHMLKKRLSNHLSVAHRKTVCPKCGMLINRKQMEQHFKSDHELKGDLKVETNEEAESEASMALPGDDGDDDIDVKDEWDKDADEDYAPPRKKTKKGRKGGVAENNGPSRPDRGRHRMQNYVEDPENPGNLLCSVDGCEYTDTNRAAMNSHMSQLHQKITCVYCNKEVLHFVSHKSILFLVVVTQWSMQHVRMWHFLHLGQPIQHGRACREGPPDERRRHHCQRGAANFG